MSCASWTAKSCSARLAAVSDINCPLCGRLVLEHETVAQTLERMNAPGYVECRGCNGRAETLRARAGKATKLTLPHDVDPKTLAYVELGFDLLNWLAERKGDRATKGGALALALGVLASQAPNPDEAADYFGGMVKFCAKLPGLDELKDPTQ